MGKHNAMRDLQSKSCTSTINMPDGTTKALLYDSDLGGYMLAWGSAVPSGVAGYAKGCMFLKTSATCMAYVNQGSSTSCTFANLA